MLGRRKHERFPGKEGGFAALFRAGYSLPVAGRIVDISLGGVGFNYLALSALGKGQFNLHLFGSKERFFHLDRIRCNLMYNYKIPERSWGDLATWHCGVRFDRVSGPVAAELMDFMSDFALEFRPPGVPQNGRENVHCAHS